MNQLILSLFAIANVTLSFAQCSFCNSLDEALIEPERVEYLDLSGQELTSVPDEMAQFVNLEHLDLSDNSITEINFDIVRLPHLEYLNLNFNPGVNMMAISNIGDALPILRNLQLESCSIFMVSPEIAKLDSLNTLNLSNNTLKALPDELENLKQLKNLNVSDNLLQDVIWLSNLWELEDLDISNNPEMELVSAGSSLLFREKLATLTVTPGDDPKDLPSVFAEIGFKKLILKNGAITKMNKRIAVTKSIKNIVFDDVYIDDPIKFYYWLNQFQKLESIEFRNMEIPTGISKVESSKLILFVNSIVEDKAEIVRIKPAIRLKAVNTDISNAGYVGNSKQVNEMDNIEYSPVVKGLTEAMVSNNLPSIVEPEVETRKIDAATPQKVDLGFSSYDIPANAFLTADGEVYKGEVELKITEYNDPFINALSGAPMTYRTGGRNEVFASSGMIEFKALDNTGNELQPNPASIIQVRMKDLQPSKDATLYSFNAVDSNWQKIGTPVASDNSGLRQRILDSLNKMPSDFFYSINVPKPRYRMVYKRSRLDPYVLEFKKVDRKKLYMKGSDGKKMPVYHHDQDWIAKDSRKWKVDTVMTKEIIDLLKAVRKAQGIESRQWFKKKGMDRRNIPVQLTDLKLTSNIENDNYRLTFKFRGALFSLPVISSVKGSIKTIQKRERKNALVYKQKLERSNKQIQKIEKYAAKMIEEGSKLVKEQRATYLSSPEYFAKLKRDKARNDAWRTAPDSSSARGTYDESLSFGLSSFGLVNCDYFTRSLPDAYVNLGEVAEDEDGEEIEVPNDVRNVYVTDNVYVSTNSRNVPIFKAKRTFMFFVISATEIALVLNALDLGGRGVKPKVKRISTKDKTPDQIRNSIFGLE